MNQWWFFDAKCGSGEARREECVCLFMVFYWFFVWLLEGGLRRNLCPMVEWRKNRHSPLQGFTTAN